jgi:rhodanese-related sulfurtransferase
MKWKPFLTPVKSMSADEAKDFIDQHREGDYNLVDVRQPKEYERSRIPGARLIPLPELGDRFTELDPEKPTIVY